MPFQARSADKTEPKHGQKTDNKNSQQEGIIMDTTTSAELLPQDILPPKQKASGSSPLGRTTKPPKTPIKAALPNGITRRAFANGTANSQITRTKDGQSLQVRLPSGEMMQFSPEDLNVVRSILWRVKGSGRWKYVRNDRFGAFHRYIMKAPAGMVVDHIDGNGLNNSRGNLRVCTNAENIRNQRTHRDSKLKAKGVCLDPGRRKPYRAQITVNRKKINLGNFSTQEEAAQAYADAAVSLHGEFARLNFPLEASA